MRTPMMTALLLSTTTIAAVHVHSFQTRESDDVIAVERAALDRWGKGDPGGFLTTYAPEITYFDPMQDHRIDGLPAMQALVAPIAGKVKIDRYEMLHPKVQRYGDVAVLTYNLVNYRKLPDGAERPASRWNSTAVFHKVGGKWRTIHSHWSFTKPELCAPSP